MNRLHALKAGNDINLRNLRGYKMYNLSFLSVVFIIKCSKKVSYLASSSVLHYYLEYPAKQVVVRCAFRSWLRYSGAKDLRSEMWEEPGGYSKQLPSARPVARSFFCESGFEREDGPKRLHLFLGWGGGVGTIRFSESTLRAFWGPAVLRKIETWTIGKILNLQNWLYGK